MRNPLVWRLILSLAAGLLITGLCLDNVSKGAATFYARYPQKRTRNIFEKTAKLIAQYEQKNGRLPVSVADLDYDWGDTSPQNRQIFDGWHRPIVYRVQGTVIQLISYGEDGKPGGTGLDYDLTNDNPNPPQARLSRLDNLRHPLSQGMSIAALVCGLFVAIITFASLKDEAFERRNWLATFVGLSVTLVAACLISVFITLMHVPSGH